MAMEVVNALYRSPCTNEGLPCQPPWWPPAMGVPHAVCRDSVCRCTYLHRGLNCTASLANDRPQALASVQTFAIAFFSAAALFSVVVLLVRFRARIAARCCCRGRSQTSDEDDDLLRRLFFNNKDRVLVLNSVACASYALYMTDPGGISGQLTAICEDLRAMYFLKRLPLVLWLACCVLIVLTWANLSYTVDPHPKHERIVRIAAFMLATAVPGVVIVDAIIEIPFDASSLVITTLASITLVAMVVPGIFFAWRLRLVLLRYQHGVQSRQRRRLTSALFHMSVTIAGGITVMVAYCALTVFQLLGDVHYDNKPDGYYIIWLSDQGLAVIIAVVVLYSAKQPLGLAYTACQLLTCRCCCSSSAAAPSAREPSVRRRNLRVSTDAWRNEVGQNEEPLLDDTEDDKHHALADASYNYGGSTLSFQYGASYEDSIR